LRPLFARFGIRSGKSIYPEVSRCHNDPRAYNWTDNIMRKMILLAVASFLWKQVQKRMGRGVAPRGMARRR
jgi:hypothetical protein